MKGLRCLPGENADGVGCVPASGNESRSVLARIGADCVVSGWFENQNSNLEIPGSSLRDARNDEVE
jgi:hypothetical protein